MKLRYPFTALGTTAILLSMITASFVGYMVGKIIMRIF